MITEDYVSFETAKLLKEKGFDWCTYAYYEDEDNPNISLHASKAINWNKTEFISKPTLQMAMKWLREEHDAIVNVFYDKDDEKWWCAEHYRMLVGEYTLIGHHNTYEQACEAAIRYCLENLI